MDRQNGDRIVAQLRQECAMSRRMLTAPRLILAVLIGMLALAPVVPAQAPPAPGTSDPERIKGTQEENLKFFKKFADEMLRLAQRWEKSDNPDDRDRAKSLRSGLELIEKKGVENLFKDLVKGLGTKNPNSSDFNTLLGKDAKLIAALQEILAVLETEDETERIRRQIKELEEAIKAIKEVKTRQEIARAKTENPRSDSNQISKQQGDIAKDTQDIANRLGGKEGKDSKGNPNPQAGRDDKSEPKPESKPGESSPENKPDTKEIKAADKPTDGADGGMKPDAKGGMDSGADKPSDGGMGGDSKPGEQKPMQPMGGDQKPMAGEPKAEGDNKGEPKPSQGQQGGDAKPMSQSGMPMSGSPSASKPSSGSPSSGQPSSGQPSAGQPQPKDPAQENVQQAVPPQRGAQEDIDQNKRNDASKKQDQAIQALERALKELEKRLKQLREKELAKLLANLEERVGRMLRMQIEVKAATVNIDNGIKKNKGQKTTADFQKSQVEAEKEMAIVAEAEKALKLMEGEGSAVVFAGVLREVKGDMESVQRRLNEGRVEEQTQIIEQDIIDQLTMMKEALKKAKQDLENQQNRPPSESQPGKPNQKLIDLLNELKLVRSLQEQVNKRTIGYSKQDPGEQANDPLVQAELRQLSDRQKVLQDMIHKIATQANQ
jgi:hypothetical protein